MKIAIILLGIVVAGLAIYFFLRNKKMFKAGKNASAPPDDIYPLW